MIVKKVLGEELLTLAEAKEILLNIKAERVDEELSYEKRKAIEHAELFCHIDAASSRKLVEELERLEKMKPELAVRIADILPETRDEVRAIYAKERFTLTEEELDTILDIVKKYA
ncbi:MAG TPA: RNA polymerase Rpb4 family protein [Candidatus Syntrophoarchaeum butanivorans]|uniref:DNA-directed RNA polymerase subunit Rpo4 n=1 Tax=Candidatus Syntropharchaeum butanivorans TaxID=1839936 RepID=A0A1F2P4T9_9EURY|nr:MAG: DNA-directed RNA polymerase subunit F [Candidatus Syntrophoarchaeum butanivorans]RJS71304.1 MAG: RNA polymerase Rpb4 family protein [Candidatus Syntrophoarchaeum sp. WYZ-LMO15]HDM35856.1 RNA polymerase Rpb4 family protein [Candidatus Syntrophoarchaeum butanivorans]HEC56478.1 RNA polymerase Rpb4 family protein [Candidatus Syntrophoarchaeum butanivorans]